MSGGGLLWDFGDGEGVGGYCFVCLGDARARLPRLRWGAGITGWGEGTNDREIFMSSMVILEVRTEADAYTLSNFKTHGLTGIWSLLPQWSMDYVSREARLYI